MTGARPRVEYLLGASESLVARHDAALLDLDGVVYRGPLAVPYAVEAIGSARGLGMRTVFVTNNANREPETVAGQLSRLGVSATGRDVITSAQAAVAMLAAEFDQGSPVLAVGGPGLRTALEEAGFGVVAGADDGPVAVAQGYAPDVSWRELAEACYAIRAGAAFLATNLDATIPTDRGTAPGNGTLVAAVRTATGVEPRSAGKPAPGIFRRAAERVGALRPVVVGDRLDTDVAGAVAAGMPALHVLTGVDDATAVLRSPAEMRPQYVAVDLRGLLRPHPAPLRRASGWWECADAGARIATDRPVARVREGDRPLRELGGPGESSSLSLDGYRALLCAAWEGVDAGTPPLEVGALVVSDDLGSGSS